MRPHAGSTTTARRRGYGLIEVAISTLLIVAALAIVTQTVGLLATGRKGAARRERALLEAANLLGRLRARPWDELTPEAGRSIGLPPEALAALPGAAVEVAIAPDSADPTAKTIAIRIDWADASGGRSAPVRLVAWAYRGEAGP